MTLRDTDQRTPPEDPEQFYDRFWRSPRWGSAEPNDDERSRLAAIEDLLGEAGGETRLRILDLGCGRGWLSHALTRYGEVLGTDVVGAAVERARELFPDLEFERTDIEGLMASHGPAAFDVVVSSEVLEHVPDADKSDFLDGVRQLVKPDGVAILTTPRGELLETWQRAITSQQPVEEWITEAELDRLAVHVGFRVERRCRAHVYGLSPLSRLYASRVFRACARRLPVLERLTDGSRIYQVVLLRRPEEDDGGGRAGDWPT